LLYRVPTLHLGRQSCHVEHCHTVELRRHAWKLPYRAQNLLCPAPLLRRRPQICSVGHQICPVGHQSCPAVHQNCPVVARCYESFMSVRKYSRQLYCGVWQIKNIIGNFFL
jgi:hypothetical protein